MAITRRQFVTRLGTLAAAMGLSQVDIAKLGEVFAHPAAGSLWYEKPRVIWVHGAECTGCSTSVLGLIEDATGEAIFGSGITTLAALDLAVGGDGDGGNVTGTTFDPTGHPYGHRTLRNSRAVTMSDFDNDKNSTTVAVNIADVLIDILSLEYHETVNGMAGDLAYQWLADKRSGYGAANKFILVVEGAVQDKGETGAWNDTGTSVPWCSIGVKGDMSAEHSFDEVVEDLGNQKECLAIVAIGQCATFGGYPACVSPEFGASQTPARGTWDHLVHATLSNAAAKVVNVPGCPTNPWWFVLTVVALLVDLATCGATTGEEGDLHILRKADETTHYYTIVPSAIDASRRLKAVYGVPMHSAACTRFPQALLGQFATRPGEAGCLQLIGCKGPSTMSLCTVHGWNGMQPENNAAWEQGAAGIYGTKKGGNCIAGGAPCMGCTESGYPDYMVPFVVRR